MEKSTYDKIKESYGKVSSWAIWNENDVTDTSIIENNVEKLNINNIIVGLNVSRPITVEWQNYHASYRGCMDKRLMKAFNNSAFRGAYITDLVKDMVEADSLEVIKFLKDESKQTEYINKFIEELAFIGVDKPNIMILGAESSELYEIFKKEFISKFPTATIKYLRYHAAQYSDAELSKEVENQLKTASETPEQPKITPEQPNDNTTQ